MGDWQAASLLDEIDLLTGFPFKSDKYTDDPSGIKLLRGDNIVQGRLRWDGVKLWPKTGLETCERYLLDNDDVVLAMDRPWIEAGLKYARLTTHDLPALLVQRVARLRGGDSLDQRFLYYLIGSRAFTDHVLAVQTGTAVPHISGKQIQSFEFILPPLDEQRAIASVLGSLDDKIELNRRMNRTLEQMAAAIFKAWFVDFEPVRAKASGAASFPGMPQPVFDALPATFADSVLGPIPDGWEVRSLGEVCEKPQYGFTESAQKEPVGPHFIRITDINKMPWVDWSGVPYCPITPKDHENYRVALGDILIARMADPGHGCIIESEKDAVFASYLIRFRPEHERWARYLQYWLRSSAYWDLVRGRQMGSTRATLNAKVLADFPLVAPSTEILDSFSEQATRLRDLVVANVEESQTLAETRDALLPKLLSGEVRVSGATDADTSDRTTPLPDQLLAMSRLADELEATPTPEWPQADRVGENRIVMPVLDNGPAIERFEQLAYKIGLVLFDFDWGMWQDSAQRFIDEPERVDSADLQTIQQLTTTVIRAEKFCEGTLADMHERGVLTAICRRCGGLAKEVTS